MLTRCIDRYLPRITELFSLSWQANESNFEIVCALLGDPHGFTKTTALSATLLEKVGIPQSKDIDAIWKWPEGGIERTLSPGYDKKVHKLINTVVLSMSGKELYGPSLDQEIVRVHEAMGNAQHLPQERLRYLREFTSHLRGLLMCEYHRVQSPNQYLLATL